MQHSALFSEPLADSAVRCLLCPAECRIVPGKAGICRVRVNRNGVLVTDAYGELVTLAIDPIEKKPLHHFYPGSTILSTGPNCCNLGCLHCQNWSISQEDAPTLYFSPKKLAALALDHATLGVAFTYSEPVVWYEYLLDVLPLLRQQGQKVVLVTNGYLNPDPLERLLPLVDAMNVDLKGMRPEFYHRVCRGKVEPVLEFIRRVAASPVHLELTNLIIPEENDSDEDLNSLIEFVASLPRVIPLHFLAYHPDYRLSRPATPETTLVRARNLAESRLPYVYLGNIGSNVGTDTHCPACGALLITRRPLEAEVVGVIGNRCRACESTIPVVWEGSSA